MKTHALCSPNSSQNHIPKHVAKDQEPRKGECHCRAPAAAPAESAQETSSRELLINIKITKIHTSALFTVCDGDRTVPKESKALERKQLARKERGKRRGSWEENIRGITQGRI